MILSNLASTHMVSKRFFRSKPLLFRYTFGAMDAFFIIPRFSNPYNAASVFPNSRIRFFWPAHPSFFPMMSLLWAKNFLPRS